MGLGEIGGDGFSGWAVGEVEGGWSSIHGRRLSWLLFCRARIDISVLIKNVAKNVDTQMNPNNMITALAHIFYDACDDYRTYKYASNQLALPQVRQLLYSWIQSRIRHAERT